MHHHPTFWEWLMRRFWPILLAVGVLLTSAAAPLRAQPAPGRVTGIVRDASPNVALTNATITIDGRAVARSGEDGRYVASPVTAGVHKLRVQLLGYAATENDINVTAGVTRTVDVPLRVVSGTLQQIVTVGYGSQKRSDLTGSVASVSPNVDRAPITSLEQTLRR